MLPMNKIKPVACALAVCLALTAVCFAAYTAVLAAGTDIPVLSAGTNIAETYLSVDVKEPAGDENGCSPLEISYTIDCAALKKQAGADAKIVTTISYMPSAAGDADAAAYALREAECAIDGAAAAAECVGEGFGCRLTFVAEPELPEGARDEGIDADPEEDPADRAVHHRPEGFLHGLLVGFLRGAPEVERLLDLGKVPDGAVEGEEEGEDESDERPDPELGAEVGKEEERAHQGDRPVGEDHEGAEAVEGGAHDDAYEKRAEGGDHRRPHRGGEMPLPGGDEGLHRRLDDRRVGEGDVVAGTDLGVGARVQERLVVEGGLVGGPGLALVELARLDRGAVGDDLEAGVVEIVVIVVPPRLLGGLAEDEAHRHVRVPFLIIGVGGDGEAVPFLVVAPEGEVGGLPFRPGGAIGGGRVLLAVVDELGELPVLPGLVDPDRDDRDAVQVADVGLLAVEHEVVPVGVEGGGVGEDVLVRGARHEGEVPAGEGEVALQIAVLRLVGALAADRHLDGAVAFLFDGPLDPPVGEAGLHLLGDEVDGLVAVLLDVVLRIDPVEGRPFLAHPEVKGSSRPVGHVRVEARDGRGDRGRSPEEDCGAQEYVG